MDNGKGILFFILNNSHLKVLGITFEGHNVSNKIKGFPNSFAKL